MAKSGEKRSLFVQFQVSRKIEKPMASVAVSKPVLSKMKHSFSCRIDPMESGEKSRDPAEGLVERMAGPASRRQNPAATACKPMQPG